VAIAYLALAWLLTEVAGTLFPGFGVPDWAFRFVVIALALGFIPALVFSWAYEITPEGLKREKDVVRDTSITHQTAKRLDLITISLIVVALVFIAVDRLWLAPRQNHAAEIVMEAVPDSSQSTEPESLLQLDSIAVLPFANRSANPDDVFFVDGIHDDLLTYVSQIGSLRVISRTSVIKYRDSIQSIPEIAGELGVTAVLEGGVQRAGEQVRINVQLIDARTDDHIWSQIYDRKLTAANIFAIQSEIAESIAEALRANLTNEAQQRLESVPTENLAALEAYFLGRQSMVTRTVADLARAAEHFEKAVSLDPDFALAYVGQADTYLLQASYASSPWNEMLSKSQKASERAIQLDPFLGEAYASLAKKKNWSNDDAGAEVAFRKAIQLSPNYAPSYQWYGEMLGRMSERIDEALDLVRKAVDLDPKSAIIINDYAEVLENAGRIEEALSSYKYAIELEPKFAHGHVRIGLVESRVNGRFDEAVRAFKKAHAIDPESTLVAAEISRAYLNLGDARQAEQWLNRLRQLTGENDWYVVTATAELLLFRNEIAQAMEFVRQRLTWEPDDVWALMRFGHNEIRMGRAEEMLPRYRRAYPELFADEPVINGTNLHPAVELALVLKETGSLENAERMLELSLTKLADLPALGRWRRGPLEARMLASHGHTEQALAALRRAIDMGWRLDWWYYLEHDPAFRLFHGDAVFQAMKSEIVTDMAGQLTRDRQ